MLPHRVAHNCLDPCPHPPCRYAYCANLTIIDTPGFILKARNGEADSTPDDIMRMVRQQAAPSHRLILFLQQSSVEWASSLWLHVVQEVDPTFSRTVMVARWACAVVVASGTRAKTIAAACTPRPGGIDATRAPSMQSHAARTSIPPAAQQV